MFSPHTSVGGISFDSAPIMVGAGTCKTPETTQKWLGAAPVVSGSYTKEPRDGNQGNTLHYPANFEGGVVDIWDVAEQLKVMEEVDLPLLVHGEAAKEGLDPFDREAIFYQTAWEWLLQKYPSLRIVAEHITTTVAAEAVA